MEKEKELCPKCGSENIYMQIDFLKCQDCGWNEAYCDER